MIKLAERRAARANRACVSCRARKQRCIPPAANARPQAPCQRCVRHRTPCSFENDQPVLQQEDLGPSQLARIVVELQKRSFTLFTASLDESLSEIDSMLMKPDWPCWKMQKFNRQGPRLVIMEMVRKLQSMKMSQGKSSLLVRVGEDGMID